MDQETIGNCYRGSETFVLSQLCRGRVAAVKTVRLTGRGLLALVYCHGGMGVPGCVCVVEAILVSCGLVVVRTDAPAAGDVLSSEMYRDNLVEFSISL